MRKLSNKKRIKDTGMVNEIYNLGSVAVVCGFMLAAGTILSALGVLHTHTFTTEEICYQNSISYELVETVAEYTHYTEEEVVNFFIIIADDIEAWEAIKMLDSSLTDDQIQAIMEISAMKQDK